MSARRKRSRKGQSAPPTQTPRNAELPAAASQQSAWLLRSLQTAADECVGALCFIEVTLHSLESQGIASSEQEVLRRALKAISIVRGWLGELRLFHLGTSTNPGTKP